MKYSNSLRVLLSNGNYFVFGDSGDITLLLYKGCYNASV